MNAPVRLERPTTRLKTLLAARRAPIFPGTANALFARVIEDLGYAKAQDGIYRSSSGERLNIELRSNGEPVTEKSIVPVADMWTRLGIATDPMLVPPQRITEAHTCDVSVCPPSTFRMSSLP